MPGRNGVTAPITPASRTTGTTAAPGRHRAGKNCISRSIDHDAWRRLSISLIPFPSAYRKIYQFLYPLTSLSSQLIGTSFALPRLVGCNEAAETDMKIYLLIMLIGALLTAVHFTSGPEKSPETLPQ
jgi:hypothetical protein